MLATADAYDRQRRADRLQVEQERARQALIRQQCGTLVWHQLDANDPQQGIQPTPT